MLAELEGRVAVVTGAASGIGRALAARCGAEGMSVVAVDVEEPRLAATAAELAASGIEVHPEVCDVADADAVDALARRVLERHGRVDLVCNNAGVAGGGAIAEASLATWRWTLGVNLWGVVHGLRAFLPAMIARGEGHVVNTASIAGHVCSPGMGPYNASKFAVVAISETLHQEMLRDGTGVGVTCLCPGFVATDILDSERNRPEPLLDATPPGSGLDEQTRAAVADAYAAQLDPAVVAELVLDAVRTGAFWVFTDDVFDDLVAARHAEIRERRTPPLHPHIAERLLAP